MNHDKPEPTHRYFLEQECEALAERLVALGDTNSLTEVFGTNNPNFNLNQFTDQELEEIYREYVLDD